MSYPLLRFVLLFNVLISSEGAITAISELTHHLGVRGQPEWDIFEGKSPEGESLQIEFESRRNEREFTLFIRQDDVKQEWTVTLNGRKLGSLFLMEADLTHSIAIPAGALRDGKNELEIRAKIPEDILIHQISIGDNSKENLLTAGPLTISVIDSSNAEALPARLTITDANGSLVPIFDFGDTHLATRPGIIYTGTGIARLKLFPGIYQLQATRGPEYERAHVSSWNPDSERSITLALNRAADTRGWVASDTHIHTFSLSRHGDALLRERILTIAGEGLELPVSTEHNVHADYQPTVEALGLGRYFTILPGNEVTTKKGHFNIFPVELTAKPPDPLQEDWPALLKQFRATPRVQIVTLNHPTDTHSGFTPFAATNLNLLTGKNLRGAFDFSFDAMELINSGAMRSDWMEPFRAWFGLLNRGYKITGVGASDSHDVSRFIVGQGRTYIRSDDFDVSRIDIPRACESLKAGHAVVSLGLFV
ncbi:MAG TPA: CehA/McbA family metallohydrolase, partial [Verrucomicrobiae bacterium]|nr:CehA/McbA family metallohydrolase [Verrucomicrobiae bacterium]